MPGRFGYVFVVTYGRSGSTLLQGVLNSLPRTVVRGENSLFVVDLFRAQDTAAQFVERHRQHRPRRVQSAFYGLNEVRPEQFIESARALMIGQLLGGRDPGKVGVLGFKEVAWHRIQPEETERFFAYFDQVFPGARYILNQRDHEQVAESGFWRGREDDVVQQALTRVEEIQEFLRETRPDRVLDTRYELLTSTDSEVSDTQLRALAEFVIGRSGEKVLSRLRRTLGVPHGPHPSGANKRPGEAVDP